MRMLETFSGNSGKFLKGNLKKILIFENILEYIRKIVQKFRKDNEIAVLGLFSENLENLKEKCGKISKKLR